MPRFIKMLVFGDYGIGKTTLLGTAADDPRTHPTLLLNFEGGELAIESKVRDLRLIQEFVDEGKAKDPPDPKDAYLTKYGLYLNSLPQTLGHIDHLRVKCWDDLQDILDLLDMGGLPYKSLLIDSLTEINYQNLAEIAADSGRQNPMKHDGMTPQLQDYGKSAVKFRKLIRSFRDLSIHSFFTALPKWEKDEVTNLGAFVPSLTGKLSQEIPGILDIAGYMTVDAQDTNVPQGREVWFQPAVSFKAKDRSEGGKLGASMKNPVISQIMDKLGVPVPSPASTDAKSK